MYPGKSGMQLIRPALLSLLGVFFFIPTLTQAEVDSEAGAIIEKAIANAGGTAWSELSTMVVHESQARNTDSGLLQMELVHYIDTKARGYRMEISSTQGKQIYGWDGRQFWARVDGKHGNEQQVKEARRLISDAYYRFTLPFVLADAGPKIEYVGKDMVNGTATETIKITYEGGPVDLYWKAEGDQSHQGHQEHAAARNEVKADEHAGHGEEAGGHHSGKQVYFYHFDKDYRIVKIYFSHHGDDSYETFLFDEFTTIDGITREQSRKLIRADGNTHYDTKFTRIEFSKDAEADQYKAPHH